MAFPSECVFESIVCSHADKDLSASDLPLYILDCKEKKADGFAADELEIYNQKLSRLKIGVRLAAAPPAISCLVILGDDIFGQIVAVDKTVIIIRLSFLDDEDEFSYLIYDAVARSLRLIAPPKHPSWIYTLSSKVSIARSCKGDDYALVHTGLLSGVDKADSLYLWRPSSTSEPWSDKKESRFPHLIDWSVNEIDTEFSFNGHAYWVDLLRGVYCCRCDALFNNKTRVAKFHRFITLPFNGTHHRSSERVSQPLAYRTMGVVHDSFIRFVSIDGFQKHVKLKNRTVTVWKLGDDHVWGKEHELSLETLWGFEGFGDLPKNLTLMYPHLSTNNQDVVYLELGLYHENKVKWKFIAYEPQYLLAVDMVKKIVTSVPLAEPDPLLSCGFSQSLCQALVGPCCKKGIPVTKHLMTKRSRSLMTS